MLLKLPMPEFTSEDRAAPPTSSDPQAQNKILFYPFNNLPIREPDAECRRLGRRTSKESSPSHGSRIQ